MGSCSGPNPLGIFRAGVMGQSDTYPGVMGRSDSGDGVEAVTATGIALRAHADGGGTGAYVTAAANPATGTPGLPLLVEATPTGVTPHPQAALFVGSVGIIGDLVVVGGAKSAAVVAPDGEHRRIYCTEMPEAWLEDAGEVELVDGKAEVAIDERLAAIVDVADYQVFLSPYAPVHAYVSRRDAGIVSDPGGGCQEGGQAGRMRMAAAGPPQRRHGRAVRALRPRRRHRADRAGSAAAPDRPRTAPGGAPPAARRSAAGGGPGRACASGAAAAAQARLRGDGRDGSPGRKRPQIRMVDRREWAQQGSNL